MLIHGACHCGNISFQLTWEPDPAQIPARACDCSFCTRHGGLWTSNPAGTLLVRVQDQAQVSPYAFGTGTAIFQVCRRCGVVPLVTSTLEGRLYAVVSVNALTNIEPARIRRAPASFEGESLATRLERRKRSWIREVRFIDAAP